MFLLSIIIFTLIYFYLCNWVIVKLFVINLFKVRDTVTPFLYKEQLKNLVKKTGLKCQVSIIQSERYFGFATRFPFKPRIFISSQVVKAFDSDELEWILLHEAGHCVLWHQHLMAFLQIALWSIGVVAIFNFNTIAAVFILSILTSTLYHQFGRILVESKADAYAVTLMENPAAMASANKKFKINAESIFYKHKLLALLFTSHPHFDTRIQMAERELTRRKKS